MRAVTYLRRTWWGLRRGRPEFNSNQVRRAETLRAFASTRHAGKEKCEQLPILLRTPTGQRHDDEVSSPGLLPNAPAHFVPIDSRQTDIEQNQEEAARRPSPPLDAIESDVRLVAAETQQRRKPFGSATASNDNAYDFTLSPLVLIRGRRQTAGGRARGTADAARGSTT